MNIELEKEIIGGGEVSGYLFRQIASTQYGYLYEVVSEGVTTHYEVFRKKSSPVCIDFENRIYSETETKDTYPKSNSFGIWAFTLKKLEDAEAKLKSFEKTTEKECEHDGLMSAQPDGHIKCNKCGELVF